MALKQTALAALIVVWFHPYAISQAPATRIEVDAQRRFQFIDGFGVNFNGTYFREQQKPLIDLLLDDLGATIFRLDPYGLTNWETLNDNNDPQVMNWEYYNDRYSIPAFEASWAAARYLNSKGIRPFITLSGTVPRWMLDDKAPAPKHMVCREGPKIVHPLTGDPPHLNPAMYEEFAGTVVSMLVFARTRSRIDFEYFSPLNETDCYPVEGPRVDPDEFPKVLGAIGRRMRREGLDDVQLVVADQARAPNDYISPVLAEAELMKQVGVFSLHQYGQDSLKPHVDRVRASAYAEKRLWLTEYGDLNDTDKSVENEWKNFSMRATYRVLTALNEGLQAGLFWDAYDNYHEHDARLTFYALVYNTDHLYRPKKRYFAAKQLYRFVRPGAQRIEARAQHPSLTVSAFYHGKSRSYVVVGLKQGGPGRVHLSLAGADPAPKRWVLYVTSPTHDCTNLGALPVCDGVIEFNLTHEAIFTLVGEVN